MTVKSSELAVPQSPDEFFRVWLPQRFEPFAARLGQASSPGSVAFHIGDRAPLNVSLVQGALRVADGIPDDTLLQVSVPEADFTPVLVRGAELIQDSSDPDRQLAVLRALTLDAERAAMIKGIRGNVAFVLAADPAEHRIVLTAGAGARSLEATECTIRCALADFLAMQLGSTNPIELMMSGKIQISGDAQIPMALSAFLV
jgi:hypothetical protein